MNLHGTQPPAKTAPAKRPHGKSLMMAATSLALVAAAVPAAAATWWDATPHVEIGSRTINVKDKGARGNGSHNDTAAIQAAIDALPDSGGTVYVPAGRYMINAEKALRLRSHTRLKLDVDAELKVIPNDASRYHLIKVWHANNVEIVGGKLTGDRARHQSTRGEWGYGINIQGARNVFVHNVKLSEFWGDGMWIGAMGWGREMTRSNGVTINNVVSAHNRRQGLSIGPAQHVYVVNSTFKDTRGTLPQAGLDIEPQDQGSANAIRLENNTFSGNRGNGIELHANISDITIRNNNLVGNHGFGALAVSAPYLTIGDNHATRNGLAGVGLSGKTHHSTVRDNKLQYNSTRYMSPNVSGGADNRDIQIGKSTYAITSAGNQLTPNR